MCGFRKTQHGGECIYLCKGVSDDYSKLPLYGDFYFYLRNIRSYRLYPSLVKKKTRSLNGMEYVNKLKVKEYFDVHNNVS